MSIHFSSVLSHGGPRSIDSCMHVCTYTTYDDTLTHLLMIIRISQPNILSQVLIKTSQHIIIKVIRTSIHIT
jgi:hypothetical protein